MTDSLAAPELVKSLADRILRGEARCPVTLSRSIEGKLERLEYVLAPLAACGRVTSVALDRATSAGGPLLGIKNDGVQHRVRVVRRHGSVRAALDDYSSWLPNAWAVPPLDLNLFGFVYAMEAVDFPGVVKVGFSRNPAERLRGLEQKHRIKLRLLCQAPGTEFSEHMIQHEFARFAVAGEWFDTSGSLRERMPWARFYTSDRMWNEVREAA